MSRPPGEGNDPVDDRDHDGLIRLVAELRATVASQQETIARQAAAIATLQARRGEVPAERQRATAQPVPGFDYTVVFDGGAIGNPGLGYGSYQIVGAKGAVIAEERLDFGDQVTNNQAEYRTLIRALEDLRERVGSTAGETAVAIRGDSQLVVLTVTGRWKVKEPTLRLLFLRAVELLGAFGKTSVAWQGRAASVRVLGH